MSDQPEPLLYNASQVAALLCCGRTTVWELMRSGKLESVKVGRSRRIPRDAVESYIAGLRDA